MLNPNSNFMKYSISTLTVVVLLALALPVYAQPAGNAPAQGAPAAPPAGTQTGRSMLNVETASKAIAEIEIQLAAMKEALKGAVTMAPGAPASGQPGAAPQAGQPDMQAAMAENQKRQEAIRAAAGTISNQLMILDNATLQAEVTRLQEIARKAQEEKATATAEMIQSVITERTQAAQKLGVRIRTGAPGGAGGGAIQEPALKSGFEWID